MKQNSYIKYGKRLYTIYTAMMLRCYMPNHHAFKYYGSRGIRVCDEWIHNKETFFTWAKENGYEDGLTIDRIDNDGNYEPSNCRWATYEEQANNRSDNLRIEFRGQTKTLSQWCRKYGLDYRNIYVKIHNGGDAEDVLYRYAMRSLRLKINNHFNAQFYEVKGILTQMPKPLS